MTRAAVFLDRDGVLVEDAGLLTRMEQVRILPGVPEALRQLKAAGLPLVVVSNQAVVARGLLTQAEVRALQAGIEGLIREAGGPALDGFYFCPHHPKATLPEYRLDCACRKPRPGLIDQAAEALGLDPAASYLVGDRPSDLLAGNRAGCRAIWVQTGQHEAPLIETAAGDDERGEAAFTCPGLPQAAAWILARIAEERA